MADRKQTLALHQYWQSHLDKWSDSGLNQAEYCRQNSLKPHQFGYWKKNFLKRISQSSLFKFLKRPLPQFPPRAILTVHYVLRSDLASQ